MKYTPRDRKYVETYLQYGFTDFNDKEGCVLPQCVLCGKILSNENMKPGKLHDHLRNVHHAHEGTTLEEFRRLERALKAQRLDSMGHFAVTQANAVRASYEVAYLIAIQKKPHTAAEELIMPGAEILVRNMCGKSETKKLSRVSVSNNTIRCRIDDVVEDVEMQVVVEIKALTHKFAI